MTIVRLAVIVGTALFIFAAVVNGQGADGPVTRIVIDPGHGGSDRGVIGPGGESESQLTFDLAEKLKEAIAGDPAFQVYLTRETDQNPSLIERSAVANGMKADLFLSLHAAGSPETERSGFQVYFQDYRRQAGLIEAIEPGNRAFGRPGVWIITQAAYLKASRKLAQELDQALSETLRIKGRGALGLPLTVLSGCEQPAVLIEVGTLTNPEEARRLKTQGYRDALVQALVLGINRWLAWLRDQPELDEDH